VCAKVYKRRQDLKAHQTKAKHHFERQRDKVTKTAIAAAVTRKRKEMQKEKPKVKWGEIEAENAWCSKYLVSIFEAGVSHLPDVERRIVMAKTRFGKMRHIWKNKALHLRLRLRLYIASVCSILTYGSEAWNINEVVRKKINGANSVMVSAITGKTPREEAVATTCSFNLVRAIRARRLQWLGHILRLDEHRLLQRAVKCLYDCRSEGDILMDAPHTDSWRELKMWAADRQKWRLRVQAVRCDQKVTITSSVFVPESVLSFTIS